MACARVEDCEASPPPFSITSWPPPPFSPTLAPELAVHIVSFLLCPSQVFTGLTPADGGFNASYSYGPDACRQTNWVHTFSLVFNVPTTLVCLGVLLFTLVTLFKVIRSGALSNNVTSSTLCWTAGAATFNVAWYVEQSLCTWEFPAVQ